MRLIPRSGLGRVLLSILALVVVLVVVLIGSTEWLDALGAAPKGERLARIQRSPNYRKGIKGSESLNHRSRGQSR